MIRSRAVGFELRGVRHISSVGRNDMANIIKSAGAVAVIAVVAANYLAGRTPHSPAPPVAASPHISVVPPAPPSVGSGAAAILPQGQNGHYFARVETRGVTLDMMIDTGASVVALTADDAAKLGVFPSESDFTGRTMTANGQAAVAPVKLDMVRVDNVLVYDVDAIVARPGALNVSLLGMSFLKKLASYQAESGRLILRQ